MDVHWKIQYFHANFYLTLRLKDTNFIIHISLKFGRKEWERVSGGPFFLVVNNKKELSREHVKRGKERIVERKQSCALFYSTRI